LAQKVATRFGLTKEEYNANPAAQAVFKELDAQVRKSFSVEPVPMEEISFLRLRKQNIPHETEEAVQETMLDYYLAWTQMAKPVSNNVSASKVDVNGKGKNIISTMIARNKFRKALISTELLGFTTKLERNGLRTPLQASMDVAVNTPWDIMQANPKFFAMANTTVERTFNKVSHLIYGDSQKFLTNEKLADKLTRGYNTYMLSGFAPFRMSRAEKLSLIDNMEDRHKAALKANPDNMILKELISIEGDNKKIFVGMSNASRTAYDKNAITDSWRDLFESPDTKEFAEDLVKYSFLLSGGNKTSSQFYEFIPFEWFNRNGFNNFLRSFNNSNNKNIDFTFIDQFFRHNLHDSAVTKIEAGDLYMQFEHSKLSFQDMVIRKKKPKKTSFMITLQEWVGIEEDTLIETNYRLEGKNPSTGQPIYGRVLPLGMRDGRGNRIPEYNLSANYTYTQEHSSIFEKPKS